MEESKPQVKEKIEKNQQQPEQKIEAKPPAEEKFPETQENINEINWKKFREERKKEREEKLAIEKVAKEKEAEAAALKAAMDALLNKPSHQQFEDQEETEDQRIAKLVKQTLAAETQRLEQERKKKEAQELPQKLANTYNDFSQVCSQENIDYLEYHYPEVAKALSYAPESFEKWSDVYKAVKRFVPNTVTKKEEARIEKNMAKPKAISAGLSNTGDSAPVYLDDAKRAQNWERMQRTMKGV